jgi:hypothetical protein
MTFSKEDLEKLNRIEDLSRQMLHRGLLLEQEALRRGYELEEAKAEIERHHRDFAKISEIVNRYEGGLSVEGLRLRLKEIRGIVG